MNAFILHFILETKSGFRKKQQLFLTYFFPLGFFMLMGVIMPQLNPGFIENMIPAMLIFSVMSSTFLGIPDSIVNGKTTGVFRGYRVNEVPVLSLLVLPALSTLIHMLTVAAIIVVFSHLFFGAPIPNNILPIFPLFLLTVYACSGLGVFIGIFSKTSRVAAILAQIVFIPSMIIGSLMIPYNLLPESVQTLAILLPSTHSMTLFKAFFYQGKTVIAPYLSIIFLAGTGTAAFILSFLLFKWNGDK